MKIQTGRVKIHEKNAETEHGDWSEGEKGAERHSKETGVWGQIQE